MAKPKKATKVKKTTASKPTDFAKKLKKVEAYNKKSLSKPKKETKKIISHLKSMTTKKKLPADLKKSLYGSTKKKKTTKKTKKKTKAKSTKKKAVTPVTLSYTKTVPTTVTKTSYVKTKIVAANIKKQISNLKSELKAHKKEAKTLEKTISKAKPKAKKKLVKMLNEAIKNIDHLTHEIKQLKNKNSKTVLKKVVKKKKVNKKQAVKVEFDALIERQDAMSSQVPQYTTESGFSVTDTIINDQETLQITAIFSDTPVTWRTRTGHKPAMGRAQKMAMKLRSFWLKKKVLTVTMRDRTYKNMVITSITVKKSSDSGHSLEIDLQMTHIDVTARKTAKIAKKKKKSGKTKAKQGKANKTKKKTKDKKSKKKKGTKAKGKTGKSLHKKAKS